MGYQKNLRMRRANGKKRLCRILWIQNKAGHGNVNGKTPGRAFPDASRAAVARRSISGYETPCSDSL
jgi:hypothetical protein